MSTLTDEPPVRVRVRRSWRMPWMALVASLVILAGTGLFLYPHVASWFSQKEQSRVTALAQESLELPPNDDVRYRAEQIERAHAYNAELASGAIFEANANVAVGEGTSSDESLIYEDILAITDSGFMGRLRYDALSIDLPIYHGTSDETLERGGRTSRRNLTPGWRRRDPVRSHRASWTSQRHPL